MTENYSDISLPDIKLFKKGKVRNVYEVGDRLLIVATDRISAFDYVLPSLIPDKGKVLTQLSRFWFDYTSLVCPNHLDRGRRAEFPPVLQHYRDVLDKRSMLVRQDAGRAHRMRRPRLPLRLRLEGVQDLGQGLRHQAARGPRASRTAWPSRSSPPRPRPRSATTRTSPSRRWRRSSARPWPRRSARSAWSFTRRPPSTPCPRASSSPTRSSSSAWTATTSSSSTRSSPPTPRASGPWPPTSPARASPAWTSSSSATTWKARPWDKKSDPPALPPDDHRQDIREIPGDLPAPHREDRLVKDPASSTSTSTPTARATAISRPAELVRMARERRLRRHLHRRPRHGRRLSRRPSRTAGRRASRSSRAWRSRPFSTAAEFHASCPFLDWASPVVARIADRVTEGRLVEGPGAGRKAPRARASTSPGRRSRRPRPARPAARRHDRPDPPRQAGVARIPRSRKYYEGTARPWPPIIFYRDYFMEGKPAFVPSGISPSWRSWTWPPRRGRRPSCPIPGPISRTTTREDLVRPQGARAGRPGGLHVLSRRPNRPRSYGRLAAESRPRAHGGLGFPRPGQAPRPLRLDQGRRILEWSTRSGREGGADMIVNWLDIVLGRHPRRPLVVGPDQGIRPRDCRPRRRRRRIRPRGPLLRAGGPFSRQVHLQSGRGQVPRLPPRLSCGPDRRGAPGRRSCPS